MLFAFARASSAELPARPLLSPVDIYHGTPFVGASSLVLTSDGQFLYATPGGGDLSAFRRQADGTFVWLGTVPVDVGEGTFRAGQLLASPDEAHLYVAESSDGVVVVFDREVATGRLTRAQTLIAGQDGLPVFERISSLAFSPLGDHLYLGHRSARTVLTFERNPATGTLSFVQEITLAEGFGGVPALAMSPGGEHLYALGRPLISILERDPSSGRLRLLETLERIEDGDLPLVSGNEVAVSPDGSSLVLSATSPFCYKCTRSALAVLRRDRLSGRLDPAGISEESIRLYPGVMTLSPDGRHVYFVDHDEPHDVISIFELHADGRLEPAGELVGEVEYVSRRTRSFAFDASGSRLLASGFDGRPFPVLERDTSTGGLRLASSSTAPADAIVRPLDLAVSPDGVQVYVVGRDSEAVGTFTWDGASGTLAPVAGVSLAELGVESFVGPRQLRIHADGSRLFVLGESTSMVVLGHRTGGQLELLEQLNTRSAVGQLLDLATSPEREDLYLLGTYGIATVRRDPQSGELTIVRIFDQARSFVSFASSPDGRYLYAVLERGCPHQASCRGLAILKPSLTTGTVNLRDVLFDNDSPYWDRSYDVVSSPDGRHLYLSAEQSDVPLIVTFSRNPDDGSLELLDSVVDGELGAGGRRDFAFSPDGRHLYSTGAGHSLVSFERDLESGELARREEITEDDLGTGALLDAGGIAVSPDSQLVYVAGTERSTVATFSRRCLANASACAMGDRFRVDVAWRDFAGRAGDASHVDPIGDSSRIFWFFEPSNWEMLVKVLDGCAVNDRLWVFAAGMTDVETHLEVTDTWTGQRRTYTTSLGEAAPAVTDSTAFATCDAVPFATSPVVTGDRRPAQD